MKFIMALCCVLVSERLLNKVQTTIWSTNHDSERLLNKVQTTIWEEIEIYSQEKAYTAERLLVDKNIGLGNTE